MKNTTQDLCAKTGTSGRDLSGPRHKYTDQFTTASPADQGSRRARQVTR